MSDHERQLIRHAVLDTLKGAIAAIGDRVFADRPTPVWPKELPAILIFTGEESAEEYQSSPRRMERNLDLHVAIGLSAADAAADQLDAIANDIEQLMSLDYTLRDTASDCMIAKTVPALHNADTKRPIAALILTFKVDYLKYAPGPVASDDPRLGNFTTIKTSIKPAPGTGQAEIDSTVTKE